LFTQPILWQPKTKERKAACPAKKPARATTPMSKASRSCSADASHQHYRLNLEKLPFCVGQVRLRLRPSFRLSGL